MTLACKTCAAPITKRAVTGLCRLCAGKRPRSAEYRANFSAAAKKRWQRDLQNPEIVERMRRTGWRVHSNPNTFTPDTNAKRTAAIVDNVLGWCPRNLRDLNKQLRKRGFPLDDRKRMIAEQVAIDARRTIAANENAMIQREQRRKAQAY